MSSVNIYLGVHSKMQFKFYKYILHPLNYEKIETANQATSFHLSFSSA